MSTSTCELKTWTESSIALFVRNRHHLDESEYFGASTVAAFGAGSLQV